MYCLPWRNAGELLLHYRQGLKPSQAFNETLKTAKILKDLNIFTFINEDPETASTCDKRWQGSSQNGALDGVMVAIKDNFCLADVAATCGSSMLKGYFPPYNATVVERALQAGALVIGKTNLDEFSMGSGGVDSIFGPTKSIWRSGFPYQLVSKSGKVVPIETDPISDDSNDWIVAGGSSCGSAVAVSSGICQIAFGSDTGGSVRIPGAWCGIPTLKPTYGSLSRYGLIPLCNSLDVPGLMARCVSDLASFFNCLKGWDEKDSTTVDDSLLSDVLLHDKNFDVSSLTVGIPVEYHCEGMSLEVLQAWSGVADILEKHGAKVKSVSLPHTPYSILCYSILNPCEVASNMARYDGLEYGLRSDEMSSTESLFASNRHYGFNDVVRGRILAGNFFMLNDNVKDFFHRSMKVRKLVNDDFMKVWKHDEVDLLLTPVTLNDAPTYREFSKLDNRTQTTRQDYCTQPVNLAGLPAVTLPTSLSSRSLPLSVQLIGRRHSENLLLNVAQWLEVQLDFPNLFLVKE